MPGRIINFGSLIVDYVYTVPRFTRSSESLQANSCTLCIGGKGLNQSIAAARAGALVLHAGFIGDDGAPLKKCLENNGIDTRFIQSIAGPSGHSISQVTPFGERAMLSLHAANHEYTPWYIDSVLAEAQKKDLILIQNETNAIPYIMRQAKAHNLSLIFHVAPSSIQVNDYPLETVSVFILNEKAGQALTGQTTPETISTALRCRFPNAEIILNFGEKGIYYCDPSRSLFFPTPKTTPKDSSATEDTFTGYYIALKREGHPLEECLQLAIYASSLCLSSLGGVSSIPQRHELFNKSTNLRIPQPCVNTVEG
jgi:ribokinase